MPPMAPCQLTGSHPALWRGRPAPCHCSCSPHPGSDPDGSNGGGTGPGSPHLNCRPCSSPAPGFVNPTPIAFHTTRWCRRWKRRRRQNAAPHRGCQYTLTRPCLPTPPQSFPGEGPLPPMTNCASGHPLSKQTRLLMDRRLPGARGCKQQRCGAITWTGRQRALSSSGDISLPRDLLRQHLRAGLWRLGRPQPPRLDTVDRQHKCSRPWSHSVPLAFCCLPLFLQRAHPPVTTTNRQRMPGHP